ncbi:hypothetical protein BaRGS_00022537 [Batillaria attramentaria]|uniref:Uncharacterized protein n=1 Tax=Batillaria attramentaria TaxID=370345 RepID=A0ABD0KGD0_9CAEN
MHLMCTRPNFICCVDPCDWRQSEIGIPAVRLLEKQEGLTCMECDEDFTLAGRPAECDARFLTGDRITWDQRQGQQSHRQLVPSHSLPTSRTAAIMIY